VTSLLLKLYQLQASKRSLAKKPVRKVQPITPEMLRSIHNNYGESSNLVDIRFVCMCLISYAGFLRISVVLNIRRNNIVFLDDHFKIFIECSKTDKYRDGAWAHIARTSTTTCPYNYLSKYLGIAKIKADSLNFIFRAIRYDKSLKCNVLSTPQLS
jgi:hypothetical protein